MVAKSPHVEEKIVDKLKLIVLKKITSGGEGGIKAKWPWVFDYDELKELTYLQATIYESLRLCPPIPLNRKHVIQEDVLHDGSVVKPGIQLIMSFFSEGRIPWIWGEDSMEFKPERWIDDQGNLSRELFSKFFTLDIGRRTCLGKDISIIQRKVCVAAVLFNFYVKLLEGQEIRLRPSITLQMTKRLLVRITERVRW